MMCWHKWGKWVVTMEGEIQLKDDTTVGIFINQKRKCEKCGKEELDMQKRYV